MIDCKKALKIIQAWPNDYDEIVLPQILAFVDGVLKNDSNAELYYKLIVKKGNEWYVNNLTDEENNFITEYEKKYE